MCLLTNIKFTYNFIFDFRSQSKASYLGSRRDQIPDSDNMGIYKRIISTNDIIHDSTNDKIWPLKSNKDLPNNNNITNILRRASMIDTQKKKSLLQSPPDDREDLKKNQMVLPDVLPVNEKFLPPGSKIVNNSSQQNFQNYTDESTVSKSPTKSPPSSPPKSPSRNSPYAPLRNTNLSSSPMRAPSLRISPQVNPPSPQYISPPVSSPLRIYPPQRNVNGNTCVSAPQKSPEGRTPSLNASSEGRPMSLNLQQVAITDFKHVTPPPLLQTASSTSAKQLVPCVAQKQSLQSLATDLAFDSYLPRNTSPTSPSYPKSSPTKPSSPPFTSSTSISKTCTPEIKPVLSPNLSNKVTPIKASQPMSSSTSTPVRASPSPPHSPKSVTLSAISATQNFKDLECPKVIEGLQLIQRTEVILRVNTTTSDASSQTEKEELPPTPLPTRRKLQEEIECEKLSQDFVNQLPVTDRLKGLLGKVFMHQYFPKFSLLMIINLQSI